MMLNILLLGVKYCVIKEMLYLIGLSIQYKYTNKSARSQGGKKKAQKPKSRKVKRLKAGIEEEEARRKSGKASRERWEKNTNTHGRARL